MNKKMKDLRDLLVEQLQDIYSAEEQILEALPKLTEKATDPGLKAVISVHAKETEAQLDRLEKIAQFLKMDPTVISVKPLKV